MRDLCAAFAMLMASAVAASAQGVSTSVAPEPLHVLATVRGFQTNVAEARLSADDVLARMMTFDRDRDGRVATGELSERMQSLVARGDRSGDGALDESEIRQLATAKQFVHIQGLGGGYGFADTAGLSSRSHIENSIDDLRLAPNASQEAKRIAVAFVEELEGAALENLRKAVASVLTEPQLAQFEASVTRLNGLRTLQVLTSASGTTSSGSSGPVNTVLTMLLVRQQLPAEQTKVVGGAIETFKAEQQLDEGRRYELVARLSALLTAEDSDNLSAALARRPLAKGAGLRAGVHTVNLEGLRFTTTSVR